MNRHDTLLEIFTRVLRLPSDVDVAKLDHQEVGSWESLTHMELVTSIEVVFGVSLTIDHVIGLDSFRKGIEILDELGIKE
jgi:acyl carrier protein